MRLSSVKKQKRKQPKKPINKVETDEALEAIPSIQHQHDLTLEYGLDIVSRSITICGEIESDWFFDFDGRMSILESHSEEPITVKICSMGGDTYTAGAIIGRMKASKCDVITEGYGCVMSAATLILAAGDKRRLSKYAWFMHHGPRLGTDGRLSSIKDVIKQTDREDTEWNKWMGEFSKKDATFWKKWSGHADLYLSPEEAEEYGVIDEII